MKVRRLKLRNIRCFEDLDIEFNASSALIIGDNGEGKSTLLRSLAMGLCDVSSASALFRELPGDFVRHASRDGKGKIEVELGTERASQYRIVTTIERLKEFEIVDQALWDIRGPKRKRLTEDSFPWGKIFATGYGPGVRVQGSEDYSDYQTVDAVYPLFKYTAPLHNPELIIRRILGERSDDPEKQRDTLDDIKELLRQLLQLKSKSQLHLTRTGIVVSGPWGKVDLASLGDGYRSTITWVLDLLAWWFVTYQQPSLRRNYRQISGIVFMDELEQHLHPKWQRNIMRLLTISFPHVQFIATTHSPLVASGCERVPVHRLAHGEHSVEHPFGWLAEDVYRMMGLEEGSRPAAFRNEVLDRVRELDLSRIRKKATSKELAELHELEQRLRELPGTDPVRALIGMKNIRDLLEESESDKHDKTDA